MGIIEETNLQKEKTMRKHKLYTFKHFALDTAMVLLTGGLWFVWIVIREFQLQKR